MTGMDWFLYDRYLRHERVNKAVSSDDIFQVGKASFSLFAKFRHFLLGLCHCFTEVDLAKKNAVTSPLNVSGN